MRIIDQLVYKITADTKGADKGLDSTGKKFDAVGKIAQVAMGAVTVGAVVKVVKELGNLAVQSTVTLDRVDKMSQKIGMSRQGFQEWDYILAQTGANVDGLQVSMKTLSSQADMVNKGNKEAIETFEELGVEVNDVNGNLKDQETLFNEVFLALSNVENETKRQTLASKLLGKSASELAPAFNQGSDAIEGLREEAHKLGLVYEDELIDQGVHLSDNILRLTRTFEALKTKAIGPVVGALVQVTDKMLGQDSASGRLEDALNKVKTATERYKTAQANAVDPTNALTEAMRDQAQIDLQYAIQGLITEWRASDKEADSARSRLEDLNATMSKQTRSIELFKRRWEEANSALGVTFEQALERGILLEREDGALGDYNDSLDELTKTQQKIWDQQNKINTADKQRQQLITDLTGAYLDYGIDLSHLVMYEKDLHDAVMANIEGVRIKREAVEFANNTLKKMNITTLEGVELQIRQYEGAKKDAKSAEVIARNTEILNLLYAKKNELLTEETQKTADLNEKEALRKEIIDNTNDAVSLANDYSKALGESFDLNSELTSIYTTAIKNLIDTGLDPADDRIAALLLKMPALATEISDLTEETETALTPIEKWGEAILDNAYALKVTGDEQAFYRAMIDDTQKAMIALLKEGVDPASSEYQQLASQVELYNNKLKDSQTEAYAWRDTTLTVMGEISTAFSTLGSLMDALSASRLQALDNELQAELEARGIADDTEMERLQKRLDKAIEAGDEELQAEIEREMARQELREDYDEKKKAIQIEDARRQKALAIFQAIIDTASAIIKAMPNPYLMGLAGTMGALQLATIQAQPLPSFDVGSLRIEQDTQAMVHKGEMVLPASLSEQARREGISIGPQGGQDIHVQVLLDSKPIIDTTVKGINSGQYGRIDARVVK